jgi:hypothetical protein
VIEGLHEKPATASEYPIHRLVFRSVLHSLKSTKFLRLSQRLFRD